MNKQEWKLYYQKLRANKPKIVYSYTLSKLLKELYTYTYTDKQEIFITLVNRYKDKLSKKYFNIIEGWKPEAKKRAHDNITSLVYTRNPFLDMLPKQDTFSGVYVPRLSEDDSQ